MSNYIKPSSLFIAFNLNENIACSNDHLEDSFDEADLTEQSNDEQSPAQDDIVDAPIEELNADNTEGQLEQNENPIDEQKEKLPAEEQSTIEDEQNEQQEELIEESKEETPKNNLISITLVEDEVENNFIITEALSRGDVIISNPGTFIVYPTIVVDSRKLDLNGSRLVCSKAAYGGALITLCGSNPQVVNGQLSGLYHAAPGEPDYLHVEYLDANGDQIPIDSTIYLPSGAFEKAVIDNVKLDHCCGYTICNGGDKYLSDTYCIRHVTSKEATKDGWQTFPLTLGYQYVTARHAIGYNYCISSDPVQYIFIDADGTMSEIYYGVPGEAIKVPTGSIAVQTKTSGKYVQYGVFEYKYDNSLTISNCDLYCNQRLAIANLPGVSVIKNCRSWSNGYPREDHTGITWDSSTSGFIDIEDVQSPYLSVINCTSSNENLGVASRAYNLYVEDCSLSVCAYGGWEVEVHNHKGRVCHNSVTVPTKIRVYNSKLVNMHQAKINSNNFFMDDNTTVELSTALNQIRNFKCIVDNSYVKSMCIYLNDVVVGKIYETVSGWFSLGTKQGSDLEIVVPPDEKYEVNGASGDCWGIKMNSLVLPNGHTIHDSQFYLDVQRMNALSGPSYSRPLFNGTYENCKFDVHIDEPFISRAIGFDAPISLIFTDCNFTIDDGLVLIRGSMGGLVSGSSIVYNNCTLNGEQLTQELAEKITSHNNNGVIINIS